MSSQFTASGGTRLIQAGDTPDLDDLGVSAQETVVIGDSLDTDIKGGLNIGTTTILVNTGKMTAENLENSQIQPDLVIPSIAELFEWI